MSIENDVKLGIIGIQSGALKALLAWVRVNLGYIVANGLEDITIKKQEFEDWEKIIVQTLKADTKEADIDLVGRTDTKREEKEKI